MAIPANELRIGNWFYRERKGEKIQLQVIADYMAVWFGSSISEFPEPHPIPLSGEVLEACGFKLENRPPNDPYWYEIEDAPISISIKCDFWCIGQEVGEITSLHQLQNLYHSLTNKELIYKQK